MRIAGLCLLLLFAAPSAVFAQSTPTPGAETGTEEAGPAPTPAPKPSAPLDLDRLLRPPGVAPSMPTAEPDLGGRDRAEWREEFEKANAEVVELESKVEVNQQRLRANTAGDWNYSPAGGEASDPEVLKLRAQLRRDRQSLEAARQRLRDLRVEASLAGVPEAWLNP
ncbi:MAG: hypothetical protein WEF50_00775 [Myxococcota bacterium]